MPKSRMATPLDMIDEHLAWMRAARGKYADTTIRDAGKILRRLHRDLPAGIHQALPTELATWMGNRRWSEQTASTYYKHVVRFFRWSVSGRSPWLSYDPSAELARPEAKAGLPRPATAAAVQVALFQLAEPWRLAARLTALAGLRPCELAIITRDAVTREWITITGKGGRTRAIPTHPLIWATVEGRISGRLITGQRGQPLDAEAVSKAGAYHLRRAGLDITLYNLRHYFGTEIQARHRDLRVTQELMGHSSPVTTAIYTQVTDARKVEAVSSLPFAGGTPAGPTAPTTPPAG